MTRAQIFIVSVAAILVTGIILVLTGILPGLRPKEEKVAVKLAVWGIMDRNSDFEAAFSAYRKNHPNVEISYSQMGAETYETDLLNALAAGRGPDIFMFRNNWLPKHFDKIVPLPAEKLSVTEFKELFPRVVEQDFAPDGPIYALPLYIDTLALLYNKDIFDNKALAITPKTWTETQNSILKIRELSKKGEIVLAGAAIGGTERTVTGATDLLSILMMQTGAAMTDPDFTRAQFAVDGLAALEFYTGFSDPKNKNYTWDEYLNNSFDAFAAGKAGMIFNYAYNIKNIRERNPFLRIGIAEMPQPNTTAQRIDYPSYYGLAVSAKSQGQDAAWDLIKFITTDETASYGYLQSAKHPPALRSLINGYLNDPDLGVFARQALTARSWPQIDNNVVVNAFSAMIENINAGKLPASQAIRQAEEEISGLMRRR